MSHPCFPLRYAAAVLALSSATAAGCHRSTTPAADAPGKERTVSVGYGTADEKELTTPVSSLTDSEIEKANVGHVEQLFEGRVSGVQVTRLGNGEFSVRIRGTRSFSGGNEPLIIIDGVPAVSATVGLTRVTPSDVKRIDVLKGAAATMYGSRGANGVILITTKRGAGSR
jgi:TonB-dependent SusC/RagA subfamily outer membrane receptor